MRTWSTGGIRVAVMLGLGALLSSGAIVSAEAQEPWSLERAERMETKARSLSDQRDRWEDAAWMYRQAARLREAWDPEAVIDLQMAGRLAYYTGNLKQSLDDLRAAGDRAMEGGDVFTAGNLLVDAAWVAGKIGRESTARKLVARAEGIVAAPVLSDAVRNSVLARIDATTGLVTVAADFDSQVPDPES